MKHRVLKCKLDFHSTQQVIADGSRGPTPDYTGEACACEANQGGTAT